MKNKIPFQNMGVLTNPLSKGRVLQIDQRITAQLVEKLTLFLLLLLHIFATCTLLPPWEVLRSEPLLYVDHPIHTERTHIYREALYQSGLPWGYDPAISAGLVITPKQDVGAKPIQVFGLFLPFLSPGAVERLFVFLVVLTFPLWTFFACRRLNIPIGAQVWIMIVLLGPAWLYGMLPKFFTWGVVAFAAASYFSPFVLALFINFLDHPSVRSYLFFLFAGSVLFLLHILGPVVLVPALGYLALTYEPLPKNWRVATFFLPVGIVLLNSFWLIPFLMAFLGMPQPPYPPPLSAMLMEPHMTYLSWSDLAAALTFPRLVLAIGGLVLAGFGLVALRIFAGNGTVKSFTISTVFGLLLKFLGSFLPVVVLMQPARFIVPTFALMTIPVGVGLFTFLKKAKLPVGLSGLVVIILVACGAVFMGKPEAIPLPSSPYPLTKFIKGQTSPSDRLLVQSLGAGNFEPHAFPLVFDREVIGNNFPERSDPTQFLRTWLWGKELSGWSPHALRSVLDRWGISWVFTLTTEAQTLFTEVTGDSGIEVGRYHAFEIIGDHSRVLIGKGQVQAKINSLELTDLHPENGLIVLRYRYHPGWETASGLPVDQYPIPEDPFGFIALKDPPDMVMLSFNPWKMLRAPWPNAEPNYEPAGKDR